MDDAWLGVVVLDDVEHVARQQVVRALQVVMRLGVVDRRALLLVGDGLGRDVFSIVTLHRVADVGDRLDVLLGLVAQAVEAGRRLVRLNLLSAVDVVQLQHQPGGRARGFQLLDTHITQSTGLDLPATVRRRVDNVQLLAGDLVQHLLRAEQVLDDARGAAVAELREVRDDGEVLVRRPVVVQQDVVGLHLPLDPLDLLADDLDLAPGFLDHQGDLVPVPGVGDRARVTQLDVDEVLLLGQGAELALDDADVPAHPDLVVDAVVTALQRLTGEAVAHPVDAVVHVGEGADIPVAQGLGVGVVVQDGDVRVGHPLRDEAVGPGIRVILLGVGVNHDVLGVLGGDADLALHTVGEVETHVVEAPRTDDPVIEDLGAHPRQLVVLGDLQPHLRQYVGSVRVGPGRRAKEHLVPVDDLLTLDGLHRTHDLVDRQRRPTLQGQRSDVLGCPLLASEELLALVRLGDEVVVRALGGVPVAVVVF